MDLDNFLFLLGENDEDICVDDIFETSSSSSDDGIMAAEILLQNRKRRKRICIKNYEEVIESYADAEFITHFRLSRSIVKELVERYKQSNTYSKLTKYSNSRAYAVSAEKTILVFLWYAGHQTSSFRDVADRFNLCLRSLHDIISRVCEFLATLAPSLIKWPTDIRKAESKVFFQNNKGIPKVIGCIDGSHIKIDKPTQRHTDYCNRKGYYSVILQGVCDERKKFINIFIGFPGSTHDARVFKSSTLYKNLDQLDNDFYILGDSAYPVLPYLMTPYRDNGHLSLAQKHFNKKISSARVFIEHSFGMLKQRFRQLYHIKLRGHKRICKFIRACCVLHNIGNESDLEIFEAEEVPSDEQPENEATIRQLTAGSDTRNRLCEILYASR